RHTRSKRDWSSDVCSSDLTVTNTGNVTLENYTVTDVLFPEWSGSIATLAPDATRSFALEYTVTQADIDNGGVVNVASDGGENPRSEERRVGKEWRARAARA